MLLGNRYSTRKRMTDLFGDKELRALSWKEPFASLMLHGKIETRTWATKYRGLVLICASKDPYTPKILLGISGKQVHRITDLLTFPDVAPTLGHAIAVGELVDCRPMVKADEDVCFVQYREPWQERRVRKDGSVHIVKKRLWCHIYENVREIEPIEWSGVQGWKILDDPKFQEQIKYL